jgi:phage recombination protein Bet
VIETIKQTVAKGASDAQLKIFLALACRYSLDPFLREIWCAQIGGQMTVMTSRDGYLKIAQRDPDFDGLVSATVCENDLFEIDPITPQVKHAFGAKRGEIVGAYAACFDKQRRPVVCFAPFDEYRKDSPTWRQYPSAMVVNVAEALALKRQFGISGLVTVEEGDDSGAVKQGGTAEPPPEVSRLEPPSLNVRPAGIGVTPAQQSGSSASPEAFDVKRMSEEFARVRKQLGDEQFFQILASQGLADIRQIRSVSAGRRVYRQLVAAIKANGNRESK